MVKLRAMDRKMLRDLMRMRGQAIAIALVMIAGVATYVTMRSVMETLQRTLESYYARYRFADGFASVRRASESHAARIRAVPGVGVVETRVVSGVNLTIPGFNEPVSGTVVSIPAGRQPLLNRLFVREGRLVSTVAPYEVVLNEAFANAHGLRPGDHISAILNGTRRSLTVVGIALSPEFLMQLQPGSMFPDPQRYGVLWMARSTLAAAYDMEGAFNDVAFTVSPGASAAAVIEQIDRLLEPYGGHGAYARADQPSNRLISEEFRQLGGMATLLPAIFLSVAAFLLNIVVTRLIGLQREQIGILKAFGHRNAAIGAHYVKLVMLIALVGAVIGTASGSWLGRQMAELYLEFYRFPFLEHTLGPGVMITAAALTTGAALVGVARAIRIAMRLPPAEAMRPAAPPVFRPTVVERLGLQRLFDQPTRMVLRSLERQPVKAALTTIGIASACAILIMGLFWTDAVNHIIRVQYGVAQRDDLTVGFIEPASTAALYELRSLPGVRYAEPFRVVPVRLRHEHRRYDTAVEGIIPGARLRRVIDTDLQPIAIPGNGIVLTDRLARQLRVRPGDSLTVEVREGDRRTVRVPVASLAEQYLGVGAYMDLSAANRLSGGGDAISGAYLMIDDSREQELNRALQARPYVASIVSQDRAIQAYMDTAGESLLVFTFILSLFAGVIAFGVVYNSARISLSERDRELASLRVLGFTRGEVAYILLAELAVLVLLAVPVGFGLGALLSGWSVAALESDLYSFPLILGRRTFAVAATVVLIAAAVSSVLARRQINRLDMVGVLKTRE